MRHHFHRLVIVLYAAVILSSGAFAYVPAGKDSFAGLPANVYRETTVDGATVWIYEVLGNEKGEPYFLKPGIVASAHMLDGAIAYLHSRGKKVFVAEDRLVRRPGQAGRGGEVFSGRRSGIEEVSLYDFPAQLRVVNDLVNGAGHGKRGRKLRLYIHSLAGIELLAAASDPRLGPELKRYIRSVTLLTVPYELQKMGGLMRREASLLLPGLRALRDGLGAETLEAHTSLFDYFQKFQSSSSVIVSKSARLMEVVASHGMAALLVAHGFVDRRNTSRAALVRLPTREISPLALDLIIDLAEAAERGYLVRRDGTRLIHPANFTFPVQVVRADKDFVAPMDSQLALFRELGSHIKQLYTLRQMTHGDVVVSDKPGTNFLPVVVKFHDNPVEAATNEPHVGFERKKSCEHFFLLPSAA